MNTPQVSIIIPVYNASNFLEECLESILNQSFKDYELILVNDGSTDDSFEICKKYKEKDKRIKILTQENQGSSSARNKGLASASGEYILLMDADDWLEPNMINELYSTITETNADIVCCGFFIDSLKKPSRIWNYPYQNEKNETILKIHMGYSALWNKLIRKSLFEINKIKGVEGITMWEDNVITLPLRYLSKKTICIPKPLYHYRVGNNESICQKSKGSYPESEIKAVEYLLKYFEKMPNDKLLSTTESNIKVLAKDDIFKNQKIGGVKNWKSVLPLKIKDIISCQLTLNRKLIRLFLLILPARLGQILVNISFR